MAKTFEKRSRTKQNVSIESHSIVFVVVRHTRSGDKRVGTVDPLDQGASVSTGESLKWARQRAFDWAERIADEAARDYGHGSSSVYEAELIVKLDALRPGEAK